MEAMDICSSEVCYTDSVEANEAALGWHVLWTRSNCEQAVRDQLVARDYEVYLPMMHQWSRRTPTEKAPVRLAPMFKGYLFVRHYIDKSAYLDISNTRGLVRILGERWNHLARVPDAELDTIKRLEDCRQPMFPYRYLRTGDQVRIIRGSLRGTQGILAQADLAKNMLVISVHLLQRSVAISVKCEDVLPV